MTEPYYEDEFVRLFLGDCRDVLAELPDCSVDAVVCDPPYDLTAGKKGGTGAASLNVNSLAGRSRISTGGGFMGQQWDATGVAFDPDTWRAALRVLKPGGLIVAFGGTRTFHRLACAIEDAGFEIRDSLAWIHGQGFPKNLNVSEALRSLPACSCRVGAEVANDESGIERAGAPASTVGAGAGAEPCAVSPATSATDLTQGVGPEVITSSSANDGASDMDTIDINGGGKRLPVVLRASSMTTATEGEQITEIVSGIQRHPEALRDQVVGQQTIGSAAVGTCPVSTDNRAGYVRPASPLVLPLSAAPGGVVCPVEASPVVDDHAGSGTVDAGISPTAKIVSADGASVDSVAGSLHAHHSTAERPSRCEVCGGVRGVIPRGLGTALKPAFEPIVVARKPLAGTVAANVLQHGTGALNIDGCRIEGKAQPFGNGTKRTAGIMGESEPRGAWESGASGRWPANVVLDEWTEPVLRLRYNVPVDVERVIREAFGASTDHLPAVRNSSRGASKQSTATEVLFSQMPGTLDVGEPDGRECSALWEDAHAGGAPEDVGSAYGSGLSGTEEPAVDGRNIPVSRVPHGEDGRPVGRGSSTVQLDEDAQPVTRGLHPGAPVDRSANPRATATSDGARASHQRAQAGQPAGESGDPLERGSSADARAGRAGGLQTPQGERATAGRVVEVLRRDIPAAWLKYFEGTGRTVRGGQAAALDEQSGTLTSGAYSAGPRTDGATYGAMHGTNPGHPADTGGASRFFYTAKADSSERPTHNGVAHPTVKPLDLMRWLVRLVTPPGGTVLEPFAGSGTTVEACLLEGFRCVAVEREADYLPLILQRIHRRRDPVTYLANKGEDLGLFGGAA